MVEAIMDIKICVRCGKTDEIDSIGEQLYNFVCRRCRCDDTKWNWGVDVSIAHMIEKLGSGSNGAVHNKAKILKQRPGSES